ncbi:hypothetical protein FB45DRAFT_896328 [Roridomyces roridus]|uniref:Arrestin-like N-terminal domain-containing protein n=1 Tax=Roridomyces roridus TaxID=1738132 RepID=A0AAD7FUH3_9AGAR|nr:hypothetical protein FB45DRAFT_896328 [Roridomyces roridus]
MDLDSDSPGAPLFCPPCYSLDPAIDETRLSLSPLTGTRPLPTGIFTKGCSSATVILYDQEPNTTVPCYGRGSYLRGSLLLDRDLSNICQVSAKLQARMEVTTSESGIMVTKFLNETLLLWSASASSSTSSCPASLSFTFRLPTSVQLGGVVGPLPPSYGAKFNGYPALFAQSAYILTISITRSGKLLSRTKTISIPLEYIPQTRPPRVMLSSRGCFFASLRAMPEEWDQTSFIMRARSDSPLAPIQCQVFSPSVKVFGLADTIPLHLQMCGDLASLREFILPCRVGDSAPTVRAYLTRMTSVVYRDRTTWRTQRIGEGHFRAVPPEVNFDDLECECDEHPKFDCEPQAQVLDWRGEVRCSPGVTVGGFRALAVSVKDFITIEVTPPRIMMQGKAKASPLMTVQHAIPIRLTTDSFVEPA